MLIYSINKGGETDEEKPIFTWTILKRDADVLKLLGDKTRLSIVSLLSEKAFCVCELVEIYNMSQPAISQHLRKMRDLEIV